MTNCIQIQWTCPSIEEARHIAHLLIEKKCVACVNIVPRVESIYEWEGKIERHSEVEVLMKTQAGCFDEITALIKSEGSYDVPAVLVFPITDGNKRYLDWVKCASRINPSK